MSTGCPVVAIMHYSLVWNSFGGILVCEYRVPLIVIIKIILGEVGLPCLVIVNIEDDIQQLF